MSNYYLDFEEEKERMLENTAAVVIEAFENEIALLSFEESLRVAELVRSAIPSRLLDKQMRLLKAQGVEMRMTTKGLRLGKP